MCSQTTVPKSHIVFAYALHLQLKGTKWPLVLQNISLFYPLVSKERATTETLCILCEVVSHSPQPEGKKHACVFIISQPNTSVSHTMSRLLLISLQLMPAGQRSGKVRLLPLITLCASARIKSCSFHPRFFHIFKARRCLCVLIDLFCLPSPARLFSLIDCCYQWMEGKQADMCALFVMHKQEVARLGRVGDGGMERRERGRGGVGGAGGLYQSASSSTQPCKWGSGYQSHSPASLSEWS